MQMRFTLEAEARLPPMAYVTRCRTRGSTGPRLVRGGVTGTALPHDSSEPPLAGDPDGAQGGPLRQEVQMAHQESRGRSRGSGPPAQVLSALVFKTCG
jgi:hypothetical protein